MANDKIRRAPRILLNMAVDKLNGREVEAVISPRSEVQANKALEGLNNPDPTALVTGPTPIGTFGKGKYE